MDAPDLRDYKSQGPRRVWSWQSGDSAGSFHRVGLQLDKILECPTGKGKDILWVIKTFTWMVGALLLRLGGEVGRRSSPRTLSCHQPPRSARDGYTPRTPSLRSSSPQGWTSRRSRSMRGMAAQPAWRERAPSPCLPESSVRCFCSTWLSGLGTHPRLRLACLVGAAGFDHPPLSLCLSSRSCPGGCSGRDLKAGWPGS